MKYFDTHAHVGLIHEDQIDQLIVVQEAKRADVKKIISICNNLMDFFTVHDNLVTSSHVYHSIGISPSEVQNPGRDWEMRIEEGAKKERVIAIGETGLDYYRKFGDRSSQVELFIHQLELADHLKLPVIIHNREAGKDVMEILQNKLPKKGGVLHCYSENWEYGEKVLSQNDNIYISFAGNVTYRNARNLHETAVNMPLDRMVVESESPFMVPAAYRGKRNKPSYIHSIVEFLAELRELPVEEMGDILYSNACRLFGLEE